MRTVRSNIPATVPYLSVDTSLCQRWRERLSTFPGLRVGIVWQGNLEFEKDRNRSVRLKQFRPVSAVPGVCLFSLQVGTGSEQVAALAKPFPLTDLGKEIADDFRDTAAVVSNLDLVIRVDTSVAHLTGALSVPVWILLPFSPDWRWLLEREDSPWYPTARLFRQPRRGDWDSVFNRVVEALRQYVQLSAAETSLPVRSASAGDFRAHVALGNSLRAEGGQRRRE